MCRIAVLTGSVSLFLLLAVLGAPFVASVAASQEVRRVPTLEYPTIQAAVDAANPGDIIQVDSRTYYEHVVVNKSLTLVGKDSSTTFIDGNGTGIVVRINAPDVEIRGFTVQNGGDFPNSGILLGSCVRNTIRDNVIRENAYGMELSGSNGCVIVDNKILNNSELGIRVSDSSDNVIHSNTIANNPIGLYITSNSSLFNTVYYNNFINNTNQVPPLQGIMAPTTEWDDGADRGNYWSDYTGVDDGSNNRTAGDGVGDTLLPHQGVDWYPLMRMRGDVNGDEIVDNSDLILVAINLGPVPPKPPECDINGDGTVNVLDVIIVVINLGKTDW